MYYPKPFSLNDTAVRFSHIYTNIGNDYNETSGNFTCQHPGIYLFTLHLYKSSPASKAACDILKDGKTTVTAYSMPLVQQGVYHLYEAGNSVVLHLNRGDTILVGNCERGFGFLGYSSFTGVLMKAD